MSGSTSCLCKKCNIEKPFSEFYADQTKRRHNHHSVCKECVKADRKRRYDEDPKKYNEQCRKYAKANRDKIRLQQRKIRQEVLDAYGNKCACCRETTQEFLAVDHVNNDGESHRRELAGYGRSIYKWLKKNGFPQDGRFQLLCHNCNMAKGLYGGCPHQGPVPGERNKTQEFV